MQKASFFQRAVLIWGLILGPTLAWAIPEPLICRTTYPPVTVHGDASIAELAKLSDAELRKQFTDRWNDFTSIRHFGGTITTADSRNSATFKLPRLFEGGVPYLGSGLLLQGHLGQFPDELPAFQQLGFKLGSGLLRGLGASPPPIKDFMIGSTMGLIQKVRDGVLGPNDLIAPALGFQKFDSEELPVYRNPLLDRWPDPGAYGMILQLRQIPHLEWAQEFARGRLPISLEGDFFVHDSFGHFLELFRNPAEMRVTRAHQRRYVELNELLTRAGLSSSQDWVNYTDRNKLFAESLVLANLGVRPEVVRSVFPDFESSGLTHWTLERDRLQTDQALAEQAFRMGWHRKELLRPIGAAVRETNREMLGAAQLENYLSTLLIGKNTEVDFRVEGDRASNWILESLWGLAEQVEVLRLALYPDLQIEVLPKFFEQKFEDRRSLKIAERLSALIQSQGPAGEKFAKTLLKNRVARVRAGIINGLKLGLTPEQVILDSTSWNVDRASATYRFFMSFSPEGTVYYPTIIDRMQRPEPKAPRAG